MFAHPPGTSMCTLRHMYVHPKAQEMEAKTPSHTVMTVKSKKVQNFKIFNRVPMGVYTWYGVGNVQY